MIFCGLVRCSGFVVWMVKFLDCMGCWVVVFMDVMMDRCLFVWLDWTGLDWTGLSLYVDDCLHTLFVGVWNEWILSCPLLFCDFFVSLMRSIR